MRAMAWSVYAPSFISAIGQNALNLFLPLYVLELGGDAATAAAVVGLRGVGTMIMDVPAGLAIARWGDKRVMLVGLVLLIVMASGCAMQPPLWMIAGFSVLFGMGMSIWMLGRLNYVTDEVPLQKRGRVISVMAGLQRAGALIGPALGGLTAQFIGFEAVFAGAAVLFVLSSLFVIRTARAVPPQQHEEPSYARLYNVVKSNASTFSTAGVAMVALQIVRSARMLMIPLWGAFIGLDAVTIGFVFSLSSAIDMAMFYPVGLILDHKGRRWTLVPSMAILALSVALLPLTTTLWPFAIVAVLSGFGNGFGTGIFMTLGGDLSPTSQRSEFLGVWRLVGDVGTASGPFIVGGLAQATSIVIACGSVAGIGVLGIVLIFACVPETLKRTRHEDKV
ncbi:MAG: MFS transporter [Gammaproteobacteria bacterium]|nr:MFS transporter [Gammaproteobacteria bacterium]